MSDRVLVYTDDGEDSRCTVVLLRQHSIAFKQVDATGDHKLLSTLSAAGYNKMPVVMVGNDVWTGYRPEKIKAILRTPLRIRSRRGRTA